MELSQTILSRIKSMDKKLNQQCDHEPNELRGNLQKLLEHGRVEVGWRESCGTTGFSLKAHREWVKVVKILKKEGLEITEDQVKHKNSYATLSGGFWQSIVYTLISEIIPASPLIDPDFERGMMEGH